MSKSIHTQKHMTLSDRIYIEQTLSNHDSFKDIAAVLKKDPSTISKEIRKHRRPKDGSHYHLKNNCALLSSCNRRPGFLLHLSGFSQRSRKPVRSCLIKNCPHIRHSYSSFITVKGTDRRISTTVLKLNCRLFPLSAAFYLYFIRFLCIRILRTIFFRHAVFRDTVS